MKHKNIAILTTLSVVYSLVDGIQHFTQAPVDTVVNKDQTVVLRCHVAERKGRVQWTLDGIPLGYNVSIPSRERYSMITEQDGQFDLRIENTTLEDDAQFECQVLPKDGEPALRGEARLTVNVECESPVLLRDGDTIMGGSITVREDSQTVKLECEARNCKPSPRVVWYRNDIQVTDVFNRSFSTGGVLRSVSSWLNIPKNRLQDGKRYRCEVQQGGLYGTSQDASVSFNVLYPPPQPTISGYRNRTDIRVNSLLTVTCNSTGGNPMGTVKWYKNSQLVSYSQQRDEYSFVVTKEDNKAVLKCVVTNSVTDDPPSNSYKLKIIFPPTTVTMTGNNGPIKKGERVSFYCVTSPSNPGAEIVWFVGGKRQNASISERTVGDNGDIKNSTLRLQMKQGYHGQLITCRASNTKFPGYVEDVKTLQVIYPPTSVKIQGFRRNAVLNAGDYLNLTCVVEGGNPRPTIKWKVSKAGNLQVIGTGESLSRILTRDDNEAKYICEATTSGYGNKKKKDVQLTVYYSPKNVSITEPIQIKEDERKSLTCSAENSNPNAQFSWLKDGKTFGELSPTDDQSKSIVSWIPTASDNNALVVCRVSNFKWGSKEANLTLSIKLKPKFLETLPSVVDIVEGDDRELSLTNPTYQTSTPDVTYTLTKTDGSETTSRVSVTNGNLIISSINRHDNGNYRVNGINEIGNATYSFRINVKYPAEIIQFDNVTSDEGATGRLHCKVDANPTSRGLITWHRRDSDLTYTYSQESLDESESTLFIPSIQREHAGEYTCVADNMIGEPDSKTSWLKVNFAPEINSSSGRVAGDLGSVVTLRCRVQGFPNVTISWKRNGQHVVPNNKYNIHYTSQKSVDYESNLVIRQVAPSDYGIYVCVATNSKGQAVNAVNFTQISKPDPPHNITLSNASAHTITLSWQPGFDGGKPQSFRIRYKRTHDVRGYVYQDVRPYGSSTFKVTGLQLGTSYDFQVISFNEKGKGDYTTASFTARTADADSVDLAKGGSVLKVPLITILIISIIGLIFLVTNIGLILYCVKRQKNRNLANAKSSMSGSSFISKTDNYSGKPSVDSRSYGTCEKSLGDLSDEIINYDNSESQIFLPEEFDMVEPIRFSSSHSQRMRSYTPTYSQTYSQSSSRPHSPEYIPNIPPDYRPYSRSSPRAYSNSRKASQNSLSRSNHSMRSHRSNNHETERKWIDDTSVYKINLPPVVREDSVEWDDQMSDQADELVSRRSSFSDSTNLSETDIEVIDYSRTSSKPRSLSPRHGNTRADIPSVHRSRRSLSRSRSSQSPRFQSRSHTPPYHHHSRISRHPEQAGSLEMRGHLV